MSAKTAPQAEAAPKKKRSLLLRSIGWFFKGLVLLLVLLLLAIGGGGYWLLQTNGGQAWLVSRANKMLDGGQPNGKMRFHITSLSGSLPFTVNAGLEALDDRGVFLKAPQNSFVWKWRELPGCIHIEKLNVTEASLLRLPDLPPAEEPKEPSKPLSFDDIRAYIGKGAEFLARPPSWMPIVKIDNVALVNATLPQSLLGGGAAGVEGDKQRQEAENESGPKQDGDAQKMAGEVPDTAQMLRADADIDLALDKAGAAINAVARLANGAGKKVWTPDFAFETANLDLNIRAMPRDNGLGANLAVKAVLDEPALGVKDIPADLLGRKTSLDLGLEALASCPGYGPADGLKITLAGPNLDAGRIQAKGAGSWQSGPGFAKGEPDGPLSLDFRLDLANGAPDAGDLLAMLRSPLNIATLLFSLPDL